MNTFPAAGKIGHDARLKTFVAKLRSGGGDSPLNR
jgi:hypothetical protein